MRLPPILAQILAPLPNTDITSLDDNGFWRCNEAVSSCSADVAVTSRTSDGAGWGGCALLLKKAEPEDAAAVRNPWAESAACDSYAWASGETSAEAEAVAVLAEVAATGAPAAGSPSQAPALCEDVAAAGAAAGPGEVVQGGGAETASPAP